MWLILLLLMARATGALFIYSGVSKLMARDMFATSLHALPFLPARSITAIVTILPWLEVVLGSILVMGFLADVAAWVSLALLLAFSLVAVVAATRGLAVPCSCFGGASQAPLSWRTVIRNALLTLLLLPLIVIHRPSPLSIGALDELRTGSFTRLPADTLLIAAIPLCVVVATILVVAAQQAIRHVTAL